MFEETETEKASNLPKITQQFLPHLGIPVRGCLTSVLLVNIKFCIRASCFHEG